jgi:hypothetical protein
MRGLWIYTRLIARRCALIATKYNYNSILYEVDRRIAILAERLIVGSVSP